MSGSTFVTALRVAMPFAVVLAASGCADATSSGPESKRLTGVYSLSDWLYVFGTDTLDITNDSYLQLEFIDDEHVRGEGYLAINVPVVNSQGEVVDDPQPVLWRQTSSGPGAVTFEGWYYVTQTSSGEDMLKFRFAEGAGGGTLIDDVSWRLSDDWRSYAFDALDPVSRLRIVQSVR